MHGDDGRQVAKDSCAGAGIAIENGHARALFDEASGSCGADATGASGDENAFVV